MLGIYYIHTYIHIYVCNQHYSNQNGNAVDSCDDCINITIVTTEKTFLQIHQTTGAYLDCITVLKELVNSERVVG